VSLPLYVLFCVQAPGYDSCVSTNRHLHVAQCNGVEFLVLRFEVCHSLSFGSDASRALADPVICQEFA